MKKLFGVFVVITIASCSFDNKTGIWKDAANIPVDNQVTELIANNIPDARYENIFTKNKTFSEEKKPTNLSNIELGNPVKISNWFEQYATSTNNISNFSYSDNKLLISKSRKLGNFSSTKNYSNRKILFYKKNLISYDHKGTIFVYSSSLNKKIFQYNFYKKNFKNINKKINLIVNKNILYVADNLGYLYALNLDDKSIVWAKNFGIPFRSNLKISNNQIFLASQDNVIYSINSSTGEKNWQFATGLTFLKSDFQNNFALDLINNNLFFLNTSGELYSINYRNQKINWVVNFKNFSLAGDTELFLSHPLVVKNNNLIITTEKSILSYNVFTASKNWNLSAEPVFKPIITLNYTYVILKNNLLICLDNLNGNVVWSKNILSDIKKEKIKNKLDTFVDFKIVNSEINLYFKNGYLLSFNPNNGNLNFESKISKKGISSKIIFLDNNMLFTNNQNKLLKFN